MARPGAVSLDMVKASLSTLIPGQRYLGYYDGSDVVWHEQMGGWPIDEQAWVIYTADGEIYEQDMIGGSMLSHFIPWRPGRRPVGLRAAVYQFPAELDEARQLAVIQRCRAMALRTRGAGVAVTEPSHWMAWDGSLRSVPRVDGVGAEAGGQECAEALQLVQRYPWSWSRASHPPRALEMRPRRMRAWCGW
jgi:hypothetical protein